MPNCNNLALNILHNVVFGFDTYNLNLATQYGIIISNVPSYSPSSIAEFAVTQAINIVRNQNDIQRKLKDYDFRWEPSILSRSISDLTVAVIGTGRIGSIAASIFAKGYRSHVVAYDPFPNEKVAQYVEYKDTLEEALRDADIVTVHIRQRNIIHISSIEIYFQNLKRCRICKRR